MEKLVIVYGFNYDWKIYFKDDAILCKCIETNLPVYAAPYIIQDTEINIIIKKIKQIEETNPELFDKINKLAKCKYTKPSWKIVKYDDKLNFDVGYESEGDENGDGR